ncbi:hypothetical protein J437_LFUL003409 [Ladona fulva]|uniref:Major facilitator superfamily (MFS) profile domain-containing protein n=1 Tax=Ladona fulva TaxID=123851 RepID=A0A8K0K759_LADFU|nr:hypothetical protein J437_LFUL003409 [Ladona fulva]
MQSIPASMASFCAGLAIGWTSPVTNRLQGISGTYKPLDHPLTDFDVSWITSLLSLGAAFGPLLGGVVIDRFGRKPSSIAVCGVPAIVGWIVTLCAKNAAYLYAARFLIGISTGSASTLTSVYIGEVSSASERGALCSFPQLFITFGILLQYAVGPYVTYEALAGINLAFPIIYVASFFFMPESPYHLLAKGKIEEAERSLVWLRGRGRLRGDQRADADIRQDLETMAVAIEDSQMNSSSIVDSFKDLFSTTGNRRALAVTSATMLNQQLSGINAVLFNAESIFRGSNPENPVLSASASTIVIGVVQVGASWTEVFLADRAGRRALLLISSAFSAIALAVLGVHSYLQKIHYSSIDSIAWLPIASLILYIIFYCLGLGPLPWAVLGEVFPSSAKSAASIFCGSLNWVVSFIIACTFQSFIHTAGAYGTYWFYACCCGVLCVYKFFFLPETKCKTLEEIQAELSGKRPKG